MLKRRWIYKQLTSKTSKFLDWLLYVFLFFSDPTSLCSRERFILWDMGECTLEGYWKIPRFFVVFIVPLAGEAVPPCFTEQRKTKKDVRKVGTPMVAGGGGWSQNDESQSLGFSVIPLSFTQSRKSPSRHSPVYESIFCRSYSLKKYMSTVLTK